MNMSRDDRKESRVETGRSTRVPLGVPRSRLAFPDRPGYVRRVINDVEGRLANAELGGWSFVQSNGQSLGSADIDNTNRDLGTRVSRVVDRTTGQKAYLMEIKEEYYKEDQAAKAAKVAEIDRRIKNGTVEKVDGSYIPDDGQAIRIETR